MVNSLKETQNIPCKDPSLKEEGLSNISGTEELAIKCIEKNKKRKKRTENVIKKKNINPKQETIQLSELEDFLNKNEEEKLSILEKEYFKTIQKIDESLNALDEYEQISDKIPTRIYEIKDKFLENRRQTLKVIFDVIAHRQKMNKEEMSGESISEILDV